MYLPDINFWLPLTFDLHTHHAAALAWFNGRPAGRPCYFCRYTQLGFLRLASNPRSNPLQTQTLDEAWAAFDHYLTLPSFGFLTEPAGLEPHWRNFAHGATFSHHVWNDAYLAAFALAGGCEVVTFDAGFTKFAGVAVTYLP